MNVACSFGPSQYKKDAKVLESIQRTPKLVKKIYKEEKRTFWFNMEKRRLRGDLTDSSDSPKGNREGGAERFSLVMEKHFKAHQ